MENIELEHGMRKAGHEQWVRETSLSMKRGGAEEYLAKMKGVVLVTMEKGGHVECCAYAAYISGSLRVEQTRIAEPTKTRPTAI